MDLLGWKKMKVSIAKVSSAHGFVARRYLIEGTAEKSAVAISAQVPGGGVVCAYFILSLDVSFGDGFCCFFQGCCVDLAALAVFSLEAMDSTQSLSNQSAGSQAKLAFS